jgi:DNA primase
MSDRHRNYLKTRNFDPNQLEQDWGLLGTGPVGPFAHRIIIPIIQSGKLVCYQGRDITGKSPMRYKSCPDDKAILPIKSCLYGLDQVTGDSVVVTEGPTKVWRLGAGSVCTFGATVTDNQVGILKQFKRVFLLFDEDEAGEEGANGLAHRLVVLGTNCMVVSAGIKDAAELSNEDAKELMNSLY